MIQDSPMKMKWTALVKSLLIVVFFAFVTVLLFAYFPPPLLDRIQPSDKAVAKLQQENKQLKTKLAALQKNAERYREQAEFFKKKAQRPVRISSSELQNIHIPDIQTSYITWQAYQKQNPKGRFSDYRQQQVSFLQRELGKSIEFLNHLKNK